MRIIDFIDVSSVTAVLIKNPMMQHLFLSITDLEGNTLSSTDWRGVCKYFHRINKNTLPKCNQSDRELANQLDQGKTYALYTCFNNLTDAAVPILLDGERIGNLVVGQVFLKPPDMELFYSRPRRVGLTGTNI